MLTVSQLLKFNTFIRTRKDSLSSYHSTQREPSQSVYIGLMIHNKTRDLVLIEKLSKLGLCVSKHRVSQPSISMGNTVIEAIERDGIVPPLSLQLGVFSTASVGNIDVEIQSSLSATSLHRTAASINQHPTEHNQGQPREKVMLNQNVLKLRRLPDCYTEIKPFHLPNDVSISHCTKPITSKQVEDTVLIEDEKWLQDTNSSSWAVFHSQSQPIRPCQDTSVMLPILPDNSKSPATIKYLLRVLMQSMHQLNPNQTAVIGFYQPLYALAKKIQWFQPAKYGQQNLVLILSVLHIEMVLLSCLGNCLQDSRWTTALSNAGVTSSENASLLSGHEVRKTKYVHQVTVLTLYQLMKDAFEQSKK